MKLKLLIVQLFLLLNLCKGQSDTAKYPDFSKYNSLRYELGYQTSPFIGLGYSHFTVDNRPFHFGSYGYYVSLEYDFSKLVSENKNYYGLKVGWEASGWFLMYALELKYLNNSTNSQVVFTPKFGLSLCGFINILYGYNLPDKLRLEGISNNQISIIANINRKIIKDF